MCTHTHTAKVIIVGANQDIKKLDSLFVYLIEEFYGKKDKLFQYCTSIYHELNIILSNLQFTIINCHAIWFYNFNHFDSKQKNLRHHNDI